MGQEDLDGLSEAQLLRLQRSGMRLGISTHCYEELARALPLKPSYIALGPILPTTCKSMNFGPQDFPKIAEWVELMGADLPLVAIGGLKLEHVSKVKAQGAQGIAVVSAITEAKDPDLQVRLWLSSFGDSLPGYG